MENEERSPDLAQLLALIKDEYNVNESEIARRIGVAPATVNAWTLRKRGTKRGPNPEKLRALAREFPKFTEAQVFAAARRVVPGPLDDDARDRILALFDKLTAEQQRLAEVQLRAIAEDNQNAG